VNNIEQELSNQKDFSKYLLKKGYSTSTTARYVRDAIKFTNWITTENTTVEQVTYNDILRYIQIKNETVKRGTTVKIVTSIKHYYSYLEAKEIVTNNPVQQIQIKGIKRKTLYHILSHQELENLFNSYEIPNHANKSKNYVWYTNSLLTRKRNKVILSLMIYQGLNSEELARLKEKDIRLREGEILIESSRKKNERTLKLEAHQILDLMEYTLKTRTELLTLNNISQSDTLFVNGQGGKSFSAIAQQIMKQLKKQDSRVENAKQIRASVITHWLKHYNLREVQYRAGHKYVSSTEAYLVNDLDGLQEDITKYHPIG